MFIDPIFISVIVFGSCLAGVVSGLLGVGGGIILVPLFYTILESVYGHNDDNIHIAVTTSLANVVVTNSFATRTHILKHNFNKNVFKKLFYFILLGGLIGGFISHYVNSTLLVLCFASFTFLLSLYMWFAIPFYLGEEVPSTWSAKIFALSNGLFSSLIGIGGGSFTVPYLTAYRVSMHNAIGISCALSVVIAFSALPGNLLFSYDIKQLPPLSFGYLNGLFLASVSVFSPLFAYISSHIVHKIDAKMLKKIFSVFLFLTSIKLFFSVI